MEKRGYGWSVTLPVLLVLLAGLQTSTAQSCPPECTCGIVSTFMTVNCSNRGLTSFPQLPPDMQRTVTTLYLRNSNLTVLHPNTLENYTSLLTLYLDNNRLTGLPEGLLSATTQLQVLYLDNNRLTALPEGLLSATTQLLVLWLNNNRLTGLPEGLLSASTQLQQLVLNDNQLTVLPEGLLSATTQLQFLVLSNNQLTALPEGLLSATTQLEFLWLDNNRLTGLPEGLLSASTQLQQLYLSSNPFNCDCELSWLPAFLRNVAQTVAQTGVFLATCATPENLTGRIIPTLPESQFNDCIIVVGFERTAYMVNVTDRQVELCVNVTVPADQNIGGVTFSLTVETRDGTASNGTDYISVMTSLATFSMEQPRHCFNVIIINDTEIETTEDFIASLTLVLATMEPNRITIVPAEATVNIMETLRISVGYNETSVTVLESAGVVQLTVDISQPDASVTFDSNIFFSLLVNTSNRMATGIGDYGALTGFRLGPFSNDVRQLSFNVSIMDDMIPEEDEVFTASLILSPDGILVIVAPDLATVTILDDDGMSPVSSTSLWPVLFAPLAVILLVLVIVVAGGIVYCKRRKPEASKELPGDTKTEKVYEAHSLTSHQPSVQLRRMLPHRMIIPRSVLKLCNSIGQGEFGVVYKANLQWQLDAATEVVAVKTLKGLFTANDIDNLVQEVLKMHTFSHPNVMSLTGVCLNTAGGPAVVMPFMGNGSVLNYLKKERGKLVPPNDADCSVISDAQTQLLGMCLQISKGMEYLANEKIVHRDLAARNCMMDASGLIKVADFGLSEDVYTSTYYRQEKSDTAVKLPVRWMPPESIADGIFTEMSDVWSFGVTCWEVFTGGHIPYSGIRPVALLQLLRDGERLIKPMNPACSDEIYAMVLDCWKENPKGRPDFSKLVDTISLTLEAAAGYMDFSLSIKDEHPLAAELEVKTREGGSSVQLPSEKEEGGQRETVV